VHYFGPAYRGSSPPRSNGWAMKTVDPHLFSFINSGLGTGKIRWTPPHPNARSAFIGPPTDRFDIIFLPSPISALRIKKKKKLTTTKTANGPIVTTATAVLNRRRSFTWRLAESNYFISTRNAPLGSGGAGCGPSARQWLSIAHDRSAYSRPLGPATLLRGAGGFSNGS